MVVDLGLDFAFPLWNKPVPQYETLTNGITMNAYQHSLYTHSYRSRKKQNARYMASSVLIAGMLHIITAPSAVGQVIYDLNSDWSNTQNPNGPWSYNYNDSPITVFQTFWWGQAGWGNNYLGDGGILKGSSPAGMVDPFGQVTPPANDWQPGDVMLHALSIPYGGDSTFLNVTWTSPGNGSISIGGRAWDGQIFSGRDVSWSLSVGGQILAHRSSVFGLYRTDAAAQFAANLSGPQSLDTIPVTQGEVVEFLVAAQTYYGQFVGLDETITFTPVPEPTPVLLLLVGLIAYARFPVR
jgi:hypothetical protein